MGSASTEHQKENQAPLYRDKNLLILFTVSLITFLVLASIPPAFPKIIQALHVPPQKIGLLISVFSFPSLALNPIVGVLVDRVGNKKILVPSLILFGIGFDISSPIVLTLVASRTSKEYLATVISVNGTCCNLGRIIGPMLMGVTFGIGGINSVFYVSTAIALSSVCVVGDRNPS